MQNDFDVSNSQFNSTNQKLILQSNNVDDVDQAIRFNQEQVDSNTQKIREKTPQGFIIERTTSSNANVLPTERDNPQDMVEKDSENSVDFIDIMSARNENMSKIRPSVVINKFQDKFKSKLKGMMFAQPKKEGEEK